MILSPRLLAVAKQIKRCGTVADVGTDHAYLAIYTVQKCIAQRAYATDIAKGPIEIAKRNIEKYEMQDRVETAVCDGLKGVPPCDTVVIAGMGGQMIAKILSESEQLAKKSHTLILQPMTFSHELREYLYKNGFTITDENMVEDNGKIYTVITATAGETEDVQERYYYIGKKLIEKKDGLLLKYINRKKESIKKALTQIEKCKSDGAEEKKEELSKLLHIYSECEKEVEK